MSNLLPRAAIASVWIYQGLRCKLLGRMPHHQEIVGTVPFSMPPERIARWSP